MESKTYLINLLGGPCIGKSVLAAQIFVDLKLKKYVVEYVQEYAKKLVWRKDFETLNNQYYVTTKQYKSLYQIVGKVEFIVTDGSILHGLYYNTLEDNVCKTINTEDLILNYYQKFNNINIFLNRGDFEYEQQGRIQNEKEAKQIDVILKRMLDDNNIPYKEFKADVKNVDKMIKYIEEICRKKFR